MVFEQEEIEESVLSHFNGMFQASYHKEHTPVDSSTQVNEALEQLDEMMGTDTTSAYINSNKFEKLVCAPYTFSELDDIFHFLFLIIV